MKRANVIGLGLIGGSIALGLRSRGWHVSGDDAEPSRVDDAIARGCIDGAGIDPHADITFVAVPVLAAQDSVETALKETSGVVTDVGSVKGALCAAVDDERFVGGHPMAGSELEGLDGADADLFSGAVWVLTPTVATSHTTIAAVAAAISALGAEMVAMAPERHDEMVAVVSHVPHLAAASLMGLAADGAAEHAALLRLAAGGFRDMTRIASGHPDIWLDICDQNRDAIVTALDRLIDRLGEMRTIVDSVDRHGLLDRLQRGSPRPVQSAEQDHAPGDPGGGAYPDPGPSRSRRGDLHAGRTRGDQHRQLRGRPPRREQPRRGRHPRRCRCR